MLLSHGDDGTAEALPVWPATKAELNELPVAARDWSIAADFQAGAGEILLVPGADGASGAILGLGDDGAGAGAAMLAGVLTKGLPEGTWRIEGDATDAHLGALAFLLGSYRFDRYRSKPAPMKHVRLSVPSTVDPAEVASIAAGIFLARDLINTPANDMGPDALEAAVRTLAGEFGASVSVIVGDDLVKQNFPMIHAVGRASVVAPRLIELNFGPEDAPKVTLVGKGVSFDTGGLDIKPSSAMLLMKKDMGGAANVLGLARMIMAAKLKLRLRVLIPAVENAISGAAFRPGDILTSRKGKTVEIGNTDAEGRLILADALALADEEAPQLLIDMATLTGAARVALGPDLAPVYTDDEALAAALNEASIAVRDPMWRMPLWQPYAKALASKIADINNVTTDGFAGSITAALFLKGFVEKAASWAHLDVYGWRPQASHLGPVGGEAQGIRAIYSVLKSRYGA
ncbi:leucyl aminopeptidase family protein [Mangrovicella endophytica]|uniref:leucyl aminopeptidase family protein n=1 Tax=Mangrovicella endophytica TaxID=2066697 RepID=UPI000C9DEF7A|nr:leucyl aminopeptidase family protein [Mangrovicella endophytica]